MAGVDAGLVLLPRFTTLVGATSFVTAPLDLSAQGGAQFQVWRGPIRVSSGTGTLTMYMEDSLDCQSWAMGPFSPTGTVIPENDPKFFSYDLRLRWFRVRFVLAGTDPMVVCWAGGLLRGGGGYGSSDSATVGEPAGEVPAGPECKSLGLVMAIRTFTRSFAMPTASFRKGQRRTRIVPMKEKLEYTDGQRYWKSPPPGYDLIDLHDRLWPACGGGPIPVKRHGGPLLTHWGRPRGPFDVASFFTIPPGSLTPPPAGGALAARIAANAAAGGAAGALGVALRMQAFQAPQFPIQGLQAPQFPQNP